jgi:DNA polymerase
MTSGSDRMRLASAALRGVVIAKPDHKLVVADLANIEGRMLAWVAGERWKLQAFREYDAGTGPDLYNITAVSIIGGDPWKVDKKDRNVFGKVPDLASGYQGGVAGYQTFAKAYNVRMEDHWDVIQRQIMPDIIAKAHQNYEKWGRQNQAELEISKLEWLASEACKLAWRARHPATVQFWYALQDAAKNAINEFGRVFSVGQFIRVGCVKHKDQPWLLVKLPSGRYITYFRPRLIDNSITYEGEAAEQGKTNRLWTQVWTHGGKMTGNVCQTLARDILAPSLEVAEAAGYMPVLTVHDEIVTEVPDVPEFNSAGLVQIMATNPAWATGLPLAAAGFETHRYRKD